MSKPKQNGNNDFTVEKLTINDYESLYKLIVSVYSDSFEHPWTKKEIQRLTSTFPEGQVCIKDKGEIIACSFSIIVSEEDYVKHENYYDIIDEYSFNTHTNNGSILYGIEICVNQKYRGLGLGRKLYNFRKKLCESLNLKKISFGGRLPNYHKFSDQMSPETYVNKVIAKEIYDPVIRFQLAFGFEFKGIFKNYIKDRDSKNFAAKLDWKNLNYKSKE